MISAPDIEPAPVLLDEADMQIIIDKYNRDVLFPPLADQLFADFPDFKDQYSKKEIVERFINTASQLKPYNICNTRMIYAAALNALHFGEDWVEQDPENRLHKILTSRPQ